MKKKMIFSIFLIYSLSIGIIQRDYNYLYNIILSIVIILTTRLISPLQILLCETCTVCIRIKYYVFFCSQIDSSTDRLKYYMCILFLFRISADVLSTGWPACARSSRDEAVISDKTASSE